MTMGKKKEKVSKRTKSLKTKMSLMPDWKKKQRANSKKFIK